jgi:hypothetical protein
MNTKVKTIICPVCNGKKYIEGMGYMKRNCHECAAVGFIEETNHEQPVIIRKKPGRKPRNQVQDNV